MEYRGTGFSMEKWKRKIIKQMYKQWWSRENVSAEMIIQYFCNPQNSVDILNEILSCTYKSWSFRFFSPIRIFIYEKIYPRKEILDGG